MNLDRMNVQGRLGGTLSVGIWKV